MPITVTVSATPESLYEGHKAHRDVLARPFFRAVLIVFYLLLIVISVPWFMNPDTRGVGLALFIFGAIPLAQPMLVRRNLRKRFAATPALREPVLWGFTEADVVSSSPRGSIRMSWNAYHCIVSVRLGLLLIPQAGLYCWFPPSTFDSPQQIEEIISFAVAGGIPNVRRL